MSHFTVLVIGNNVDTQLQPFHEFECTGDDDQYVQDMDITTEVKDEYEQYKADYETVAAFAEDYHGKSVVPYGSSPDLEGEHKYGYALTDESGEVIKVIDRTNPNKQWDWWVVGGRWTGFFKAKPGSTFNIGRPGVFGSPAEAGYADTIRKRDVDFDTMRNEAAIKAAADWDKMNGAIDEQYSKMGLSRAQDTFLTWQEMLTQDFDTMDARRDAYHSQVAVIAFKTVNTKAFFVNVDEYMCDRQTYINRAVNSVCVPSAVLKDGVWYKRGKMGWWGMVSNEKDKDEWNLKVKELYDSVPDEELLTIVDCHI